jgi:hypothetical protein
VRDGKAAESESGTHWIIATHGPANSPERLEWLARIEAGA